MDFDDKILRFLAEAGTDGLSVRKLARHVYNASNSFFETVDYKDVHHYVQQFLLRKSRGPKAIIERTERRGVYRLNPRSTQSLQILLSFQDEVPDEEELKKPIVDQSLSLF